MSVKLRRPQAKRQPTAHSVIHLNNDKFLVFLALFYSSRYLLDGSRLYIIILLAIITIYLGWSKIIQIKYFIPASLKAFKEKHCKETALSYS